MNRSDQAEVGASSCRERAWPRAGSGFLAAGIASSILYLVVLHEAGKQFYAHPCPRPPIPWAVTTTWTVSVVLLILGAIGLAVSAIFAWPNRKGPAARRALGAALAALVLAGLANAYGEHGDMGPGPRCIGSYISGP
jgi:uncharacterized BrkB/YihY/UPF0761 family membrane protein